MAFLKESNPRNLDNDQREEKSFSCAMQLSTSIVLPMVLHSAIKLGVFDILTKAGPGAKLSPSQIVAQMPAKNPDAAMMLDRILKLLVSHSVLGCTAAADEDFGSFQRLYNLTPVSEYFVTNEDGVSLGPYMALVQDQVFIKSWFVFYYYYFFSFLILNLKNIIIINYFTIFFIYDEWLFVSEKKWY